MTWHDIRCLRRIILRIIHQATVTMPQLFSRAANSWFRFILAAVVGSIVLGFGILFTVVRSPYITGQNVRLQQPVPFSHQHHVADAGIDCRYCHTTVETTASAGIPATQICINCHRHLWTEAEALEPVRVSWRKQTPLSWNRVHDLPDHVFFNHSIHVDKGIGCYSCHGRIDRMPLTQQAAPMTMQWCLECHREPTQHVRPRSLVFEPQPLEELSETAAYREAVQEIRRGTKHDSHEKNEKKTKSTGVPGLTTDELRKAFAAHYGVRSHTDCYTCHR